MYHFCHFMGNFYVFFYSKAKKLCLCCVQSKGCLLKQKTPDQKIRRFCFLNHSKYRAIRSEVESEK
jgi:hypothetical protein